MITSRVAIFYSIVALLLGALGVLLLGDRPGLRSEFYPLTPTWEGSPVYVAVGLPQVSGPDDLRPLVSRKIFSVRWRGWLMVKTSGKHRFRIHADEGGYLVVDGEKTTKKNYRVVLERGAHAIEIGFHQTRGASRLETRWAEPGGELVSLPAQRLHARKPVRLRQLLRRGLAPVARPYRQLLGVLSVLAGLLVLRLGLRAAGLPVERPDAGGGAPSRRRRRWLYGGFLVGLFVLCWLWTSRFTASLMGGDDVRYVYKALFPAKGDWFFFRYVHVYLLKAFIWLRDGQAFPGSRTYWSFLFSVTVTALAVGCGSLGPRLQLRTVTVTLFLLVSQSSLMGLAGGAFTDYTAMMFVTLAVVVYLHALATEPRRGRFGWHELAIGALTVAACKSKATGIILAWLPLLFLWTEGRFDLRGFARKIGFWVTGATAGLLVVMSLDAWLLGDFWYSVNIDFSALKRIHGRREPQLWRSVTGWFNVVWQPDPFSSVPSQRYLWLLALSAPIVAVLRRRRIELRLLFLMPLGYLLLLIAVYVRAPHVFSGRHLFPIMPVCCLAAGAMFFWFGLEERSSRQRPESRTLLQHARPALMVLLLLGLLGPGFVQVQQSLAQRLMWQRGELMLYPWKVFRDEIEAARPKTLVVAPEIWNSYRMVGKSATRQTIARIFFHQQDLRLWQVQNLGQDADLALAGPRSLRSWRRQIPGLEGTESFDRSGNLALVRPPDRPRSSDRRPNEETTRN